MLKTVFLVLLVLNLVLLGANAGLFGHASSARDPARLSRQIAPELIRQLPSPLAPAPAVPQLANPVS